jgi:hypothetical protein
MSNPPNLVVEKFVAVGAPGGGKTKAGIWIFT